MTKTIVILGAGLAGLPIAHYLLSKTAPRVPELRVVLVNPSDEFYWSLASVRAIIPGQIPEDKYLWSLSELFSKYPTGKFELVLGRAETLSPAENSVVVALNDGSRRAFEYHTVIVATGSDAKNGMPWKPLGGNSTGPQTTTATTRAAVAKLQEEIGAARSIVVAGAGLTGVEVAGELGSAYAKSGQKQVYLIASDDLPLDSGVMTRTREEARTQLERLGVKIVARRRVTSVNTAPKGKGRHVLELAETTTTVAADGSSTPTTTTTMTTLETDLFIPAYGLRPNTQFAPADMLDPTSGRLQQDRTLRAPGHRNVFVLGDAGNLQPMQGSVVEGQVRHLAKHLEAYLTGGGDIEEYKFDADKVTMGISIGPGGGTGQIGTMKPFSWLIWYFKARYLGTDFSRDYAAGLRTFGGKW